MRRSRREPGGTSVARAVGIIGVHEAPGPADLNSGEVQEAPPVEGLGEVASAGDVVTFELGRRARADARRRVDDDVDAIEDPRDRAHARQVGSSNWHGHAGSGSPDEPDYVDARLGEPIAEVAGDVPGSARHQDSQRDPYSIRASFNPLSPSFQQVLTMTTRSV